MCSIRESLWRLQSLCRVCCRLLAAPSGVASSQGHAGQSGGTFTVTSLPTELLGGVNLLLVPLPLFGQCVKIENSLRVFIPGGCAMHSTSTRGVEEFLLLV